jgi:pyruvate,orthophosphate dikinase
LVLAHDARTRRNAIEHILPVQRSDFRELLGAVGEAPVAVRLLDLPLHELMPVEDGELEDVASRLDTRPEQLATRARLLRASNPVLGHRGSRLGLTFPELYEVQIRALFEANVDIGGHPLLQVVLPLVTCGEELRRLKTRIQHMAAKVCRERGVELPPFEVGAMVESPRACLIADEIAADADFLLFGSTGLTISTYAMFRDDAGRYLPFYLENDVFPSDPFVKLDERGVGELLRLGLERARRVKPDIVCGLAGGHASHPDAIRWCHEHGIDYVTCAPHRLPIARLAAAQAAVVQTEN